MDYLNGISIFDICQAHLQLEADYNVGGWLRERPSNRRRMEATACQLSRMNYEANGRWVDIDAPDDENEDADNAVRHIYRENVIKWGLPQSELAGSQRTTAAQAA